MEYLRNCAMCIQHALGFNKPIEPPEISRRAVYLNTFCKIVVWENPSLSGAAFVVYMVLLWTVVLLEIRLYGLIFMAILGLILCDYFVNTWDFGIEEYEVPSNLLITVGHLSDILTHVQVIRRKHPMPFCIVMCVLFLWLTVIARCVAGVVLIHIGCMCVLFGPAVIARSSTTYLEKFKQCLETIATSQGIAEVELLPYIAVRDQDNDLDSLRTDKTVDSVTDSLISGISSMPSHLDAERDTEDELEPPFRLRRESSTDTDSDKRSMEFESLHFNGDSSSEDEYASGLRFSEATRDLPTNINTAPNAFTNLTSLTRSFMSNVFKTQKPNSKDSDSEFEIIDSGEVADT